MMKHSLVYLLSMILCVAVFAQQSEKNSKKKEVVVPKKQAVSLDIPSPSDRKTTADPKDNGLILPSSQSSDISIAVPNALDPEGSLAPTTVEWAETEVDFGEIKQGEVASHVFYVKNTGTKPLKITRVKPSCGCTTPEWTKEEIMPGKAGKVEVAFNSAGKMGTQRKTVTVFYNTEQQAQILRFNGEIVQ